MFKLVLEKEEEPETKLPTSTGSLKKQQSSRKACTSALLRRRQWQPTPVLLPGKLHGPRGLVGFSPWSREELDMTERLHFHFSLSCIGEGNGNPLEYSCLENPRDGRAWWAAVYGVAQSWTQLKWLSSSSSCFIDYAKAFDCGITINCGKFFKRWKYQTTWPASWEICMQVRKQQLELDMEQQTGSK